MANKLEEENNSGNLIEINSLDFLPGCGEMGKLIRSKDWSKTPLGSPDTWPQSLRTTVSLGIWLFISNEIIQRHKGKLWAESEPGEGSTFYFTLPVVYNE